MEKITSRKNNTIVHLRKLGSDASYRRECCEFICDGVKTLNEALASGMEIKTVLFKGTPDTELAERLPHAASYYAPDELFDYASPLKNCPGPLFSVRMPQTAGETVHSAIVLENLQDPGNVGTVIRTANAFGISAVVLVGDCADLYNPKTVRATMGAIFRQRVMSVELCALRDFCAENGLKLYGAALSDKAVEITGLDLKGTAVAVGSEGRGLSEDLLRLCDAELIIPMRPDSESLNAAVAASVIMWEMSK